MALGRWDRAGEEAWPGKVDPLDARSLGLADMARGRHKPAMRIGSLMLLPLASALTACGGDKNSAAEGPPAGAENAMTEGPETVWGETDTAHLTRLGSAQIRAALAGKLVSYSPPGWADAGAHEEYHEDGRWGGLRYSRGPLPFAGSWHVDDDRLCVVAESGMVAGALKEGPLCRPLWRDRRNGELLMEDAISQGRGLLRLSVREIPVRAG